MISFRTLKTEDFQQLYETTLEAFSDYVIEYKPTFESLMRMFTIEGVEIESSVGVFDRDKMVGFTVNAFGNWQGISTAYDAGTGVIPEYRRRGISRQMFAYIFEILRRKNVAQYLLEVITLNDAAFQLYKNLGFEITRRVAVAERKQVYLSASEDETIEIKELKKPDWDLLKSFWTCRPSWQNSIDSMIRSDRNEEIAKTILGLYSQNELVGYGVVFSRSGNVAQLAVASEYRRRKYGTLILDALQKRARRTLFVSNVDLKATDVLGFLEKNRFEKVVEQYEMIIEL